MKKCEDVVAAGRFCVRDEQVVIANHATTTCQLILAFLLIHIDPSPGERLAVGYVEGSQIDFPHADAKFDGHQGTQKLTAGARMERGRRQLVIHDIPSAHPGAQGRFAVAHLPLALPHVAVLLAPAHKFVLKTLSVSKTI